MYMYILENEVDGYSLFELGEQDIFTMLPGKVGPARKILSLVRDEKENSQLVKGVLTESKQTVPMQVPSDMSIDDSNVETIIYIEEGAGCPIQKPTDGFGCMVENTTERSEVECPMQQAVCSKGANESCNQQTTPKPLELYIPDYSASVKKLLQSGEINKEWDKFVEETAYHVLAIGEFSTRGLYQDYGRMMARKYPCISHKAMKEPWGYFNKKLSQKVRNIRWKWAVRSKKGSQPTPVKKTKSPAFVEVNDSNPMESMEAHKILTEEVKKDKKEQDKPLMFKAFRSTFKERRSFIEGASSVAEILEKYPVLSKSDFVEKEFFMLKANVKVDTVKANWDTVLKKLDVVFEETMNEDRTNEDVLALIELLSEQLRYSAKAKAIQPLVKQCKSSELVLVSKKTEAPRLVVIKNDDETIGNCFIVGEGHKVEVGRTLTNALNSLIYLYYVWDLTYPKQYQMLGFLQHYIIEDKQNKFHMSGNYLSFTKKFEDILL